MPRLSIATARAAFNRLLCSDATPLRPGTNRRPWRYRDRAVGLGSKRSLAMAKEQTQPDTPAADRDAHREIAERVGKQDPEIEINRQTAEKDEPKERHR
jgi:hypothetical protein